MKESAFQIYYENIQMQVPNEMWGFMGIFIKLEYIQDAFNRNVPVDMVVDKIKHEYNKHLSGLVN